MGSSRTRARTRVPCIGRRILNHCATREARDFHGFWKGEGGSKFCSDLIKALKQKRVAVVKEHRTLELESSPTFPTYRPENQSPERQLFLTNTYHWVLTMCWPWAKPNMVCLYGIQWQLICLKSHNDMWSSWGYTTGFWTLNGHVVARNTTSEDLPESPEDLVCKFLS